MKAILKILDDLQKKTPEERARYEEWLRQRNLEIAEEERLEQERGEEDAKQGENEI